MRKSDIVRLASASAIAVATLAAAQPAFAEDGPTEPARDNQVLSDDQIRRILAKGEELDEDGDHFLLTLLLASTGARFSQITRMRVGDVQPDFRRVMIPPSRKGRGKVGKTIEFHRSSWTAQRQMDKPRRPRTRATDRKMTTIERHG